MGFGSEVAFGLGFGFVIALSVACGRVDEAGGVDSIVGGDDSDDAEGAGAGVRVGGSFESPTEGCGSGAGESAVAAFGL